MPPLPTSGGERARQLPPGSPSPRDMDTTKSRGSGEILDSLNATSETLEATNGKATNRDLSVDLLPEYLQNLVAGSEKCGDSFLPFLKPDWLDEGKFRRGQRFAMNNIFGVMYCELISLMMLFAFRGGLEPLIFTGKSDTPFKAFKRYLSTVTRVKSWYEGDIWDEHSQAHKNLKAVRGMHDSVRKNMSNTPKDTLGNKVTLFANMRGPADLRKQHAELAEDFGSSCPFLKSPLYSPESVYMNQCDMAITQFGFAGLVLLFPDKFGIHGASKDDLESFAHFWRTIGYLLGIEDRYNVCDGDLNTVRERCSDMIEHWVRPSFRTLSQDWLHMSKCVFDGLNYFLPCSTFELILLYLCEVLDIHAPKLKSSLNIVQYCVYQYNIFLYSCFTYLPGVRIFHNWLIYLSLYVYNTANSSSS